MTVTMSHDLIVLSGIAAVEDAEVLLTVLLENPSSAIDASALVNAHFAVVQLLQAANRTVAGLPDHAILRSLISGSAIGERA